MLNTNYKRHQSFETGNGQRKHEKQRDCNRASNEKKTVKELKFLDVTTAFRSIVCVIKCRLLRQESQIVVAPRASPRDVLRRLTTIVVQTIIKLPQSLGCRCTICPPSSRGLHSTCVYTFITATFWNYNITSHTTSMMSSQCDSWRKAWPPSSA